LSTQVPEMDAFGLRGPRYRTACVQDPTPEVASVPANVTVTGRLYQPFESGGRSGVAVTVGAVASYWSASDAPPELPARSVHEPDSVTVDPSGPL
jgi:hypothetical protein